MPIADKFDLNSDVPVGMGKPKRNRSAKNNQHDAVFQQIKAVRQFIQREGSQDLVAKVGGRSFVLTVEDQYFIDPTMNDVLNGTFRILGKVTRAIQDNSKSINLLRMTPLGLFPDVAHQLTSSMSTVDNIKIDRNSTETKIDGPTLQVIPIGIFV